MRCPWANAYMHMCFLHSNGGAERNAHPAVESWPVNRSWSTETCPTLLQMDELRMIVRMLFSSHTLFYRMPLVLSLCIVLFHFPLRPLIIVNLWWLLLLIHCASHGWMMFLCKHVISLIFFFHLGCDWWRPSDHCLLGVASHCHRSLAWTSSTEMMQCGKWAAPLGVGYVNSLRPIRGRPEWTGGSKKWKVNEDRKYGAGDNTMRWGSLNLSNTPPLNGEVMVWTTR